jgi:hypothetical protein
MENFGWSSDDGKVQDALLFEERRELDRLQSINEFFDGYLQDRKSLTGKEFGSLWELGSTAGFTDAEFKHYLKEHNVRIDSGNAPESESGNIRLS